MARLLANRSAVEVLAGTYEHVEALLTAKMLDFGAEAKTDPVGAGHKVGAVNDIILALSEIRKKRA